MTFVVSEERIVKHICPREINLKIVPPVTEPFNLLNVAVKELEPDGSEGVIMPVNPKKEIKARFSKIIISWGKDKL